MQDTEAAIIADKSINWGYLPKKITFMSGNFLEINARILEMTNSTNPAISNGKYPLVALFKDIKETLTEGPIGIESSFKCKFAILTLTTPDYRHDEREAINFKPVLIPILEAMLKQFQQSAQFGMPTLQQMNVQATDCYFYGTGFNQDNKNPFSDYVDAIEVESISLNIKNLNC